MGSDEIFESCVRSAGDLAGVFEYDGETGYFYLYQITEPEGQKVRDSIRVLTGEPDFTEDDISIAWDADEQKVGLFIREKLWAVFDTKRLAKYGGNYKPGTNASLPPEAEQGFDTPQ